MICMIQNAAKRITPAFRNAAEKSFPFGTGISAGKSFIF